MPGTTITIYRGQREGLYELVRNHLGGIEDFWVALERTMPARVMLGPILSRPRKPARTGFLGRSIGRAREARAIRPAPLPGQL